MPIDFHRSPHVEPVLGPRRIALPAPPARAPRDRFPAIAMAAPLVVGMAMLAVMPSPLTLAFVALSPLLALSSWIDQRVRSRRDRRSAATAFATELEHARRRLVAGQHEERAFRLAADPAAMEIAERMLRHDPGLWSRRPGEDGFLRLRLGLGRRPSLVTAIQPAAAEGRPEDRDRVEALAQAHAELDAVPVVARLGEEAALGIAGRGEPAVATGRSLIVQLVGHQAPSELRLVAFVGDGEAEAWSWLRGLPHLGLPPPGGPGLAASTRSRARLLDALETMADERRASETASPAVVVLVLGEMIDRARLLAIARPGSGIRLIWLARTLAELPAACRTFLDLGASPPAVGRAAPAEHIAIARVERLSLAQAAAAARAIEELVDADAPPPLADRIPTSVSLDEIEPGLDGADAILTRWRGNADRAALDARLGMRTDGPFTIDLRRDGPHALVGGTTGAGKSELLQSWICGLALNHAPDRLAFLLVDYKGGAAFADCAALPHTVGLVTDLSPRLARRALVSLRAELVRRERILGGAGAKDLIALERQGGDAPPALVIVIDEFAVLANEVPEFVDGVVDIAQRGRSLGLHLVMATQRPAGVIRESLRANTTLRIALRLADTADSLDVLGSDAASLIRADTPGRAFARIGPTSPIAFQTARLGDSVTKRLAMIRAAASLAGAWPPRRPWLPELSPLVPLGSLPADGPGLRIGLLDLPEEQRQPVLRFDPACEGHLLLVGRSGSGKSTALRTLVAAAAERVLRGEAIRIYAIDAGNGGLGPIARLPIVGEVIPLRDEERVARAFRMLADELDRRSALLGTDGAGPAAVTACPRILLLIDGLGALREGREARLDDPVLPVLGRLLAGGRSLGLHVAASGERPAAVPTALLGEFGLRIVLRQGSETDVAMLGADATALADAPPGRCLVRGTEAQLAIVARSAEPADEAARFARLGRQLRRAGVPFVPTVPILEERLPLARLPPTIAGRPSLGITTEALTAVGFPAHGIVLVAGRPRSGRSTAIRTMLASLHRAGRGADATILTPERGNIPPIGPADLLVIERAHDFAGLPAEPAAAVALREVRRRGGLAIVELDPGRIAAAWQLLVELKSADAGLFLRAEEQDALALLRVPLGRRRERIPPGRGWLVEDGTAVEVQVAMTDPLEGPDRTGSS